MRMRMLVLFKLSDASQDIRSALDELRLSTRYSVGQWVYGVCCTHTVELVIHLPITNHNTRAVNIDNLCMTTSCCSSVFEAVAQSRRRN